MASLLGWSLAGCAAAQASKSGTIQISSDGEIIWAVNALDGSVAIIDPQNVRERELSGCSHPAGVAATADGEEAWITCPDEDAVVVLAHGGAIRARIAFAWGARPQFVALSPDESTAVVTLLQQPAVAIVDARSRTVRATVTTWRAPRTIAWEPSGAAAWITHEATDGEATRLTRVDAVNSRVTACRRVGLQLPLISIADSLAEGGAVSFRAHPAPRPGTDELWLPALHLAIREPTLTSDTTVQSALHVLDMRTGALVRDRRIVPTAVHVHDDSGLVHRGDGFDAHVSGPCDIAWSRDGATAWVLHENSGDLLEYPVAAGATASAAYPELTAIPVGLRPTGVAMDPVYSLAYVNVSLTREIAVVDLAAREVIARLGTTPSSRPDSHGALVDGASLFFGSADPHICVSHKVACASCHPDGGADGFIWPEQFLPRPIGPRATTSLLGLSLTFGPPDPVTGRGQLHRSGDRDEIQDFDFTYFGPQMGGAAFWEGTSGGSYAGPPMAGNNPHLDNLAAFLLSVPPLPRSPARAPGGALTEAARRGGRMFAGTGAARGDAGCIACHQPAKGFADGAFHDVGSPRSPDEAELGSREPVWAVNTPTLVGLFATAPWDRGALVETQREHLVDVLEDMAREESGTTPHGHVAQLVQRERRDLAEYLASIDGSVSGPGAAEAAERELGAWPSPRLLSARPLSLTLIAVRFSEAVDEASASSPSSWTITTGGERIAVERVDFDRLRGDRALLHVQLPRSCEGQPYEVRPGPIADRSGDVSGLTARVLDVSDASNVRTFTLGDTITVSLGAGDADLVVPVHDAGITAEEPGLTLDAPRIGRGACGLVRFDWRRAFVDATGVADPAAITDVRISLQPALGDSCVVAARRVLKRWNDPHAGDVVTPSGAPSWIFAAAPNAWTLPGATSVGGTGDDAADYDGRFDRAGIIDAIGSCPSVGARFELAGAGLTGAYRRWLLNPLLDHGHALEIVSPVGELQLERSEDALGDLAPMLHITYRLPQAASGPPEISAGATPLLVSRDAASLTLRFEDAGAVRYHAVTGAMGSWTLARSASCLAPVPEGGGRMSATLAPGEGSAWILVAARSACGGALGSSSVAWTGACTP